MKAFNFKSDQCDLCRKCEEACVEVCRKSGNPSAKFVPHIRVHPSTAGPFVRLCRQCEDSPCVDACIGESLKRGPDGLVIQDEDRCIGCFMCNMVCPHGAMKTIMSQEKAFKCTLQCGVKKEPACALACDRGALFFEDCGLHNKRKRREKIKELPRK